MDNLRVNFQISLNPIKERGKLLRNGTKVNKKRGKTKLGKYD
jgi:hypothetical protein